MQLSSEVLNRVTYLTGSVETASALPKTRALGIFDDDVIEFLNDVSKELISFFLHIEKKT